MKSSLILPSSLINEIDHILEQLLRKTHANCILLADISGQLICKQGHTENFDPVILSALTASNMAATSEMAKQIGEQSSFRLLFHEGDRHNIYLSNVCGNFLLVVVFKATIQIGLVRLFTSQAVKQLQPIAERFDELQTQPVKMIDADFGDSLSTELDNTFGDLVQP